MTAADTVVDLHVKVKRCPECGSGFAPEAAFCPFDGAALTTGTWDPTRDPLTGTIIDLRYEVIEPLGEGGMGTVYKVRHVTLNRLFAMKVLRRDLAADPALVERFLHEARATALIRHPSVVAINDFGQLDDGAPYFVMELLIGETLAARIRGRGLLSPSESAGIAKKLADALAAAHAANVVHRDLKPENIFLVGKATGRPAPDDLRVVDFGAAKIVGASKLTRPGVVFGTPYYMSPEQASGQPVDGRADVYSLGVLLYEMITGSLPFEADTYMGVLTKHMFAAPVKPSERAPSGVQLGPLEAVVLRALEKDPDARHQSMTELGSDLERAVAHRPSAAPAGETTLLSEGNAPADARPFKGVFSGPSTADRIQSSVSRRVDDERRRKRRMIVVASVSAAATLVLCALAVSLLDRDRESSATSTSTSEPATGARAAVMAPASAPAPEPALAPSASASASPSAGVPATAPVSGTTQAPAAARPRPTAPPGGDPLRGAPAAPSAPPAPPRATARTPDDFSDPWRR